MHLSRELMKSIFVETMDLFGVDTCFWSDSDCLQSGQTVSDRCQVSVVCSGCTCTGRGE